MLFKFQTDFTKPECSHETHWAKAPCEIVQAYNMGETISDLKMSVILRILIFKLFSDLNSVPNKKIKYRALKHEF